MINPPQMLSAPVQISEQQFNHAFNALCAAKAPDIQKQTIRVFNNPDTEKSKSLISERRDFFDDLKSIIIPLVIIPGIIALSYDLGWAGDGIQEKIAALYFNYQEFSSIKQVVYLLLSLFGGIIIGAIGLTFIFEFMRLILRLFWESISSSIKSLESLGIRIMIKEKTGIFKLKISKEQIEQARKMLKKYGDFSVYLNRGLMFITPPLKQDNPEQSVPVDQAINISLASKVAAEKKPKPDPDLNFYAVGINGQKFTIDELVSGLFLMQAI